MKWWHPFPFTSCYFKCLEGKSSVTVSSSRVSRSEVHNNLQHPMCCPTGCFTHSIQLQALKKKDPSHTYGALVMEFILIPFHCYVCMSHIYNITKCWLQTTQVCQFVLMFLCFSLLYTIFISYFHYKMVWHRHNMRKVNNMKNLMEFSPIHEHYHQFYPLTDIGISKTKCGEAS